MTQKRIRLYSKVTVKGRDSKKSYILVKSDEIDVSKNKISPDAPLGRALLNKKVNDEVKVKTPKGTLTYQILSIN